MLYKQQLKSHPDAIVKFRSPRRRSEPGRVGEDGTQDEFIFPFDNPDEDGDYVDVETEDGRRRRKVQSLDHNNELGEDGQRLEVDQMGEGWLPETLKELSGSDDDDHKFDKLAKRIRREREKGEAKARAEAKKAATEAKKSAKRRPKPFPIHGDPEGEVAHLPEYIPLAVSLFMQHLIITLRSGCRTGDVALPIPILPGALGACNSTIPLSSRKITFQTPSTISGVFLLPNF